MLPKAILFDLDDTLITMHAAFEAAREACCEIYGTRLSPNCTPQTLRAELDRVRAWFWGDPERHRTQRQDMAAACREIVRLTLAVFGVEDELTVDAFTDDFIRRQQEGVTLFPNTLEVLETLRDEGVKMALLTNGASATQRAKIDRFGLHSFFGPILIEGEVGYGKPDVRVFQDALRMLGCTAADAWMVGDHLVWDVDAPQSLGIFSIWHDVQRTGLPQDSVHKPDRIITDLRELLDM